MSRVVDEVNRSTQTEESTRQRVQLDFSPEAYNRLTALRKKAEARTNAELVRNALRLYEWFLEQKDKERKIHVVDGDNVKEVELVF
jgi:hypothetical protein